jgi:preprotein translocase subunit SecG
MYYDLHSKAFIITLFIHAFMYVMYYFIVTLVMMHHNDPGGYSSLFNDGMS